MRAGPVGGRITELAGGRAKRSGTFSRLTSGRRLCVAAAVVLQPGVITLSIYSG